MDPATRTGPRPVDRIAAGVAAAALLGAVAGTIWFFAGFVENDTEFRSLSSAFLLSAGLGAFAVVPAAVALRLSLDAVRRGFRAGDGVWTLVMMAPWAALAAVVIRRAPLPLWVGGLAFAVAGLLCLWATVSLIQLAVGARHGTKAAAAPLHMPDPNPEQNAERKLDVGRTSIASAEPAPDPDPM